MARRYDSRTTIFSPEGRLYQVEYAMEAISHAGACIGIMAKDGVVLAAEKRHANKLLDDTAVLTQPEEESTSVQAVPCEKVQYSEKIYRILKDVVCGMAGFTADANVLTNELRVIAQRYTLQYGTPIPCQILVSWLCDIKHSYTQYGGKRPFGVSVLYAGWDEYLGYQLYHSDPSGNYSGWKVSCIGQNSAAAMSSLENDYYADIDVSDALTLSLKTLAKSVDSTKLSADKLEMATLTRENNKTIIKFKSCEEIKSLLDESEINNVTVDRKR